MSARPPDHEQVIELLPDYAIGGLDQAELDRIAQHLEDCPSCRTELLRTLELGALISDVAPPAPGVRRQLLTLTSAGAAPRPGVGADPAGHHPIPPPAPTPSPGDRAEGLGSRRTRAALAVAAALVLIGLVAWILHLIEDQQTATIAELISSSTVYPLMESQVSPPASGVLFVGTANERALLIVDDLPPLAAGEEYQIWLFDGSDQPAAADRFSTDDEGRAQVELTPPLPLSSYVAVAVSAEPAGGSPDPTGRLAVGGWLGTP